MAFIHLLRKRVLRSYICGIPVAIEKWSWNKEAFLRLGFSVPDPCCLVSDSSGPTKMKQCPSTEKRAVVLWHTQHGNKGHHRCSLSLSRLAVPSHLGVLLFLCNQSPMTMTSNGQLHSIMWLNSFHKYRWNVCMFVCAQCWTNTITAMRKLFSSSLSDLCLLLPSHPFTLGVLY